MLNGGKSPIDKDSDFAIAGVVKSVTIQSIWILHEVLSEHCESVVVRIRYYLVHCMRHQIKLNHSLTRSLTQSNTHTHRVDSYTDDHVGELEVVGVRGRTDERYEDRFRARVASAGQCRIIFRMRR